MGSVFADIRKNKKSYNATVWKYKEGEFVGVFLATVEEINGRLQMLRSNHSTHTGFEEYRYQEDHPEDGIEEGDAQYDHYLRNRVLAEGRVLVIKKDGGQGYRDFLSGYNTAPSFPKGHLEKEPS